MFDDEDYGPLGNLDTIRDLQAKASVVMDALDADIVLYQGEIGDPGPERLTPYCCARERRPNVMLVINTLGGDPDAAYRIARCLQRNYSRIYVYIRGWCKSAGTLVVIGATDIIMPDDGELGPLDIQLYVQDELLGATSGLNLTEAMATLRQRSFDLFEWYLIQLATRSMGRISTKLALEIATNMTSGMMTPIYAQIDPVRFGEIERSVQIASEYGKRLDRRSRNLKPQALEHLIKHYPSHGFVIDREEAQGLFRRVRRPEPAEEELVNSIEDLMYILGDDAPVAFLDDFLNQLAEMAGGDDDEEDDATSGEATGGVESDRGHDERAGDGPAGGSDDSRPGGSELKTVPPINRQSNGRPKAP